MRLAEFLKETATTLSAGGVQAASAEARTLLAFVIGVEPGQLGVITEIDDEDIATVRSLVSRRLEGVPLQHLTGQAWFRFIKVDVGPGVFIPRPETETVCGWAIDKLKELDSPRVVELCAGSGAISKAIASEVPGACVTAVEASAEAFAYLERNVVDEQVECIHADMADLDGSLDAQVDLVIANPPYIPQAQFGQLPVEVRHGDPEMALVSGIDGLDHIRVIADLASRLLKPGGVVVVEHGDDQGESAPRIFLDHPVFTLVEDHTDLTSRPRFVTAVKAAGDEPEHLGSDANVHPSAVVDESSVTSVAAVDSDSQAIQDADLPGCENPTSASPQSDPTSCDEESDVPDEPTYRVFATDQDTDEALQAAAEAIRDGACIVLPTDTVYGIGANAFDAAAVQGLLDAKRRGRDMPPPILIAEPAMLPAYAESIPASAQTLADNFWPGALTLILRAPQSLTMDLGETAGTIAVRVPNHDFARKLLRHTGPLAVSSANISGKSASTTIDDAIEMLANSVAVYLDDGPTPGPQASTIVDYSGTGPGKVLRVGALSVAQLREIDPGIVEPASGQ